MSKRSLSVQSVRAWVPPPICVCYPCSDSICLGSVPPSPYKVALHKSPTEPRPVPINYPTET